MTNSRQFDTSIESLPVEWQLLQLFEDCNKVYSQFPHFSELLRQGFLGISGESSWQAGHKWLMDFRREYLFLPLFPLSVESGDESIRAAASATAQKCEGMFRRDLSALKLVGVPVSRRHLRAIELVRLVCSGYEITCPLSSKAPAEMPECDILAAMARMIDEKWWRGQLRKLHARYLENAARQLGLVCKRKGGYCSSITLSRRRIQKKRNQGLLENLLAENDQGQVYTLDELSDMGVSNPVNRRNELMARISGFERFADADADIEWQAVFITATCPSKFHSHNRGGIRNKRWDGSTPRDAQKYLSKVWSLVRSKWQKAGVSRFGFRIAEPHHDGCPHWHLLLWIPKDQVDHAMSIYRLYSLAMDGEERGADLRRFRFDLIDSDAGSATGYISKYISKNVDGLTADGESWSSDSVRTAWRVEAWASTWGLRQFQQIGGASVTVWRELRRLSVPESNEQLEAIRLAADDGDWSEYTRLMGGPTVGRDDQPIRSMMIVVSDKTNAYGEAIRRLWGLVVLGLDEVQTRVREWTISSARDVPAFAAIALGGAGETGPPLDLCQ